MTSLDVSLTLLVMYPYLLKRKFIWRFVQLPNVVTTSQHCFLYYLSVWKIFSKNSFFNQPQGVSLSIADAKVDTFILLTKHSWKFFTDFFNRKSQKIDLQYQKETPKSTRTNGFANHTLQKSQIMTKRHMWCVCLLDEVELSQKMLKEIYPYLRSALTYANELYI